MYIDKSIGFYLDDLAAKKASPGGGSAAALTAAIGTSLMMMTANYTPGEKASGISARVLKLDAKLRALVDEDVEAYGALVKGLKAVSGDDKKADELYKNAMVPPFSVCEITAECMDICRELVACGNKNLVTDTAAAVVLLDAAFWAAKYCAYINLKYIKDTGHIAKVHNALAALEGRIPRLKEEVLEMCEDIISGDE